MTARQHKRVGEFRSMFPNGRLAPDVIEKLVAAVTEPDMSDWICVEGTNDVGALVWLVDTDGEVVMTATGILDQLAATLADVLRQEDEE